MAARPYWSGQISVSLVSFAVKLFVATESKGEIHFHQIARSTGERVRHQKVLASAKEAREDTQPEAPAEEASVAAVVEQAEIVKGYEYAKGRYVTFEPEELDNLRVPSKSVMEVTQFVDAAEIDPEYFEKPYFIVPKDDSQAPAYALVRQALVDTGKVALSKIAFGGREHIVAITPAEDSGMMAYTMRYAEELRDPHDYFRMIKRVTVDKDSLELARKLVELKTSRFDPTRFVDGYEVALKELVQAKVDKAPVPADEKPAFVQSSMTTSLLDALRQSVSGESTPEKTAAKKKPAKSTADEGKVITLVKAGRNDTPGKATKKRSA